MVAKRAQSSNLLKQFDHADSKLRILVLQTLQQFSGLAIVRIRRVDCGE